MFSRPLLAATVLALLAGCASTPPVTAQNLPQQQPLTPPPGCGNFASQPEFAPLRGKVALDNLTEQTPAMLRLTRIPGRNERTLIRRWSAQRSACLAAEQEAAQAMSSPAMAALDAKLLADDRALDARLAAGYIGYGDYARQRQALADDYNVAWQASWSEYQAQMNAERVRRNLYWRDTYYDGGYPYGGPWWGAGYSHYLGGSGGSISIGIGRGY